MYGVILLLDMPENGVEGAHFCVKVLDLLFHYPDGLVVDRRSYGL
jgi:hypothetical protein